MSLIAWLPLTNNLNNQGASNMSFTGVSATQNTFGKIGKSYTFGTSSSGARLYSELFTPKTNSFSMCCWYKAAEGNSTSGYIMGLSKAQNADFMLYKNGTTGFRIYSNGGNTSYTHGIDITKWHHLTLTNNGTTTTLYIDGVSVKTRSTPTDYTLAQYRLFLGCRSNNTNTDGTGSGYSNIGHYNDFRFYDHCLSDAEVHEISQGLVQHYKCDDLHNLITDNSPKTITLGSTATNAYSGYWYLDTRAKSDGWFKENTVYTVIYDYNATTLTSTSAYFYSQINTTRCVPSVSATGIRSATSGTVVEQFTLNAAQAAYSSSFRFRLRFYASGGDSVTISNLRIYMGKASEYTKIIDSSGYGHNGAVTGTLLPMYNTPRYQWAMQGNNNYATTDYVFDSTNLSSEFTWAGWIYRTNQDGAAGYIYSGTAVIYLYTSYDLRITWNQATADSSANNTWAPSQIMPLNTWTHAALTYKDGVLKVYVNGEYVKSNDRTSTGTYMKGYKNNFLFSGASGANAFTGGLSDMRVYCTALSDADIKQLYELGAKIDNKHNIHSYELIETGSNKITKQGQLMGSNIHETPDLFAYDPVLYIEPDGTKWAHIFHHNNPTDNKFASTDTFTSFVYTDESRWFNFAPCDLLPTYEFFAAVKKTSDDTITKYRWIQTMSPMTATFDSTKSANVTKITTTGYTSCPFGGLYHVASNTWLAMNNGTNNNWYGAVGCWNAWNGGITGWASTASSNAIKSGSVDIYVRIDNIDFSRINLNTKSIKTNKWQANSFIEF